MNSLSVYNNLNDISNDISNNLTKIENNRNNISNNLTKINNISKNKLINISNDIFYNIDIQIDFSNNENFFKKQYNIPFKKDDFIEMYFTMLLEYINVDHENYVRSICKILNDKIVLYERIIYHENYSYFNNYLTIDETIFYNFDEYVENITFSIKFEMIDIKIMRLFCNKRNNNRLISKHFGN